MDLSGYTVMPPLYDSHVHLAFPGRPELKQNHRPYDEIRPIIRRNVQDHFRYGVMGVRDGGDHAGHVLRYTMDDDTSGRVRIVPAVCGCHREGRYGKLIGKVLPVGREPAGMIDTACADGAGHVKLIQSGLNSLTRFGKQTPPQFSADEIKRIFDMARKRGLGLMVHANGEAPVEAAIAGGCDSIEHGYFMGEENLRKMADRRITWVPTAVPMKAYVDASSRGTTEHDVARITLDHQLAQLEQARRHGVTVALGTDAGSPGVLHGKAVSQELSLLMSAGYPMEAAVRCATVNAARLMGCCLSGCLGVGAPATFIVVKGEGNNLLEKPGAVEVVTA